MAPRRKMRSRRTRRVSKNSIIQDTVLGRLQANGTTNFALKDFTFTDRRRPFRVVGVKFTVTTDQKPLCVNLRLYGPQSGADSVCTYGAFLVEGIPKHGYFRNTCTLMYPSGTANSVILLAVDCPQQFGTDNTTGTILCVVTLAMGPEELPDAYSIRVVQPTFNKDEGDDYLSRELNAPPPPPET
uniref:Uncharacterized protein n=1 Tax=Clastoptera arizonana TaxID=38151 RepID=A0A1B6E682_9HEMI